MITSEDLSFVRLAMRRRIVSTQRLRDAVDRKRWDDRERTIAQNLVEMGALTSELATPTAVARSRREAKIAARLDHPNIVRVYGAGEDEGRHYIAMDLIEGQSLAEMIAIEGVSPRRAAYITRKVSIATHYAHEQKVV